MNKEVGSAICHGGKVVGVIHSHPSGSIKLSSQDIKTAREKNLSHVCVVARGETKCYRFTPKKRK